MTPSETLEKLRALDAQIIPGPSPFREMADTVENMINALAPFADAAEKVDGQSDQFQIGDNATPGWGIRRKHLNAVREILGQNTEGLGALPKDVNHPPQILAALPISPKQSSLSASGIEDFLMMAAMLSNISF
jgi:hypothetical protein